MAKPKTKPVGQDDAVVVPAAFMPDSETVTAKWVAVDGEGFELTTKSRPLYLATDAETGEVIGASVNSWAAALHDAISAGSYQSSNLAWSYNAKDGDEYAGVKLIMGSL